MSAKHDVYDDDEEDEGDFIPGADDDDDLDADFEEENLDDLADEEAPFLQGDLYVDEGNSIVYDDAKSSSSQYFRLASQTVPSGWSLQTPALDTTLLFVGWIKDPSKTIKFDVKITKMDASETVDPLEQRFLDVQAERMASVAGTGDSKPTAGLKGGDDDEEDQKKASLKAPLASDSDKKSSASELSSSVFILEGSQVEAATGEPVRKFRGLFRPPGADVLRTFVMVSIQTVEASPASTAGAAKPAAARKRGLDTGGNDDDDEADDAVGYQELIDLHDDAGLSTEELRRRYYGGGAANEPNKKPRAMPPDDDDDDDDDAYGF